jgi:hypothetical protein
MGETTRDEMAAETAEAVWYWSHEKRRPVGRQDLEFLVLMGLMVYDLTDLMILDWREDVEEGRTRDDVRSALDLDARLARWIVAYPAVEAKVRRLERRGRTVKGADELRERYRRAMDSAPCAPLPPPCRGRSRTPSSSRRESCE